MQDTHEKLKNWGKRQRFLSARNDEIKQLILSRYSPSEVEGQPYKVRRRIPWLSLVFASAAVMLFVLPSLQPSRRVLTSQPMPASSGGFMSPEAASSPLAGDSFVGKVLRNPIFQGAPITDTREFLKTNYYSTLRTRHVSDLTLRVQTIVRGFGGRVDGASGSDKSGYVSFAVPADKFELFRQEIKTLASVKLYTEQTYSENLLPQKQSIEEQQAAAQKSLDSFNADRDKLMADHKRAVASLNSKISSVTKELAALRAEVTDDPARRAEIDARISALVSQENSLRARLANEHRDYNVKLASLDSQIKTQNDYLAGLAKQDQNLLDNVATVNGTISLSWISLWEMADLYLPGPLLAWLLAAAAILAYFYHRRPLPLPLP